MQGCKTCARREEKHVPDITFLEKPTHHGRKLQGAMCPPTTLQNPT
jgi:hypothetical protein